MRTLKTKQGIFFTIRNPYDEDRSVRDGSADGSNGSEIDLVPIIRTQNTGTT